MAMTRAGAGLARRLATASPCSGKGLELANLARKLGRASPRSLEGSMGEAFASPSRRFHATRGVCSPPPPTPPTPPPAAQQSWLDLSPRELSAKVKEYEHYQLMKMGATIYISTFLSFVISSIYTAHSYIDEKMTEKDEKDEKVELKEKMEREEYERLQKNKREQFDSSTHSSLSNLNKRLLKFENKWQNSQKVLSDTEDLPLSIINSIDNLETQIVELKKATAVSTGTTLKYLEIGEELTKLDSKVSGLKEIMEAAKMSEVSAQDPEKVSPALEVSGSKEIIEAAKMSEVSAEDPGKVPPAPEGP